MDFQTHAENFDMTSILLTGASFGVFSIIGASWKDFLQFIIDKYVDSDQSTLLESFLTLVALNLLGGILLGIALVAGKGIKKKSIKLRRAPYVPDT